MHVVGHAKLVDTALFVVVVAIASAATPPQLRADLGTLYLLCWQYSTALADGCQHLVLDHLPETRGLACLGRLCLGLPVVAYLM